MAKKKKKDEVEKNIFSLARDTLKANIETLTVLRDSPNIQPMARIAAIQTLLKMARFDEMKEPVNASLNVIKVNFIDEKGQDAGFGHIPERDPEFSDEDEDELNHDFGT